MLHEPPWLFQRDMLENSTSIREELSRRARVVNSAKQLSHGLGFHFLEIELRSHAPQFSLNPHWVRNEKVKRKELARPATDAARDAVMETSGVSGGPVEHPPGRGTSESTATRAESNSNVIRQTRLDHDVRAEKPIVPRDKHQPSDLTQVPNHAMVPHPPLVHLEETADATKQDLLDPPPPHLSGARPQVSEEAMDPIEQDQAAVDVGLTNVLGIKAGESGLGIVTAVTPVPPDPPELPHSFAPPLCPGTSSQRTTIEIESQKALTTPSDGNAQQNHSPARPVGHGSQIRSTQLGHGGAEHARTPLIASSREGAAEDDVSVLETLKIGPANLLPDGVLTKNARPEASSPRSTAAGSQQDAPNARPGSDWPSSFSSSPKPLQRSTVHGKAAGESQKPVASIPQALTHLPDKRGPNPFGSNGDLARPPAEDVLHPKPSSQRLFSDVVAGRNPPSPGTAHGAVPGKDRGSSLTSNPQGEPCAIKPAALPESTVPHSTREFVAPDNSTRTDRLGGAPATLNLTKGRIKKKAPPRNVIIGNSNSDGSKAQAPPKPSEPVLTFEQEQVIAKVLAGENVFFTGPAGCGKSFLLKHIIQLCRERYGHDAVAVTASTGIAAVPLGGCTLHSFAGIGWAQDNQYRLVERLKKKPSLVAKHVGTKVLCIDEVSPISASTFGMCNYVISHLRCRHRLPFGGIQIIATGDFFQLPPVAKKHQPVSYAFESTDWKETFLPRNQIRLTQIFRQTEPDFLEILEEMRMGRIENGRGAGLISRAGLLEPKIYRDGIPPLEMYNTKATTFDANMRFIETLPGEMFVFRATDTSSARMSYEARLELFEDFMTPPRLYLKVNTPVMLVINLPGDRELVNGTRGIVLGFMTEAEWAACGGRFPGGYPPFPPNEDGGVAERLPVVKFLVLGSRKTRVELVRRHLFQNGDDRGMVTREQIALIPAYALTTHKAQGLQVERAKIDLDKTFSVGQAYTACSRVTSMAGLQIVNFNRKAFRTNPIVIKYYRKLTTIPQPAH